MYKSELNSESIYHHEEEGHHHHLICRQCGKTINCAENLFSPVQKLLKEKYHFRADFKHLIVNGLCGKCASKQN